MIQARLTTSDNPHDPFTEFDEWYAFDTRAGYHTSAYLARIAVNSTELSDLDYELANEAAIDEILAHNILGIYVKVTREVDDVQVKT